MSLLENTTCALPLHPPRPVLKRARMPYSPPEDSKRRRTSPTGAFSRLSISPTSQRGASPHHHEQPQEHDPASSPWSLILHRKHSPLPRQDSTKPCASAPSPPSYTDARMRTGYSAFEPEPNRIIVESLSDSSDTASLPEQQQQEEEDTPSQVSFEVDPEVARQLATRREKDQHHPTSLFLNSHHFISAQPDQPNNQQLVLYRKPICHPLHIPYASSPAPIPANNDDDLIIDVDLVHQPLVSPLPSPTQADLMDTD